MDNLQLKKCRLRKPECLSASLLSMSSRTLSTRTSPQNSGPPKAAKRSKPASRFNGIGKYTAFSIPVTAQADEQNKRVVIVWPRHSSLTTSMDIRTSKGWRNVRQYHGGRASLVTR